MNKSQRIRLWKESKADRIEDLQKTKDEVLIRINRLYRAIVEIDGLIVSLRKKYTKRIKRDRDARKARVTKNVT